jgi:hypothetical protein
MLEKLEDAAISSREYDGVVKQYSTAPQSKPTNIVDILVKRSRAQSLMGLWLEALDDADEVHMVCGLHSRPALNNVHQLGSQVQSIAPSRLRKETCSTTWKEMLHCSPQSIQDDALNIRAVS